MQRYLSYIVFLFLVFQFFLWDLGEIENPNDKYQSTEDFLEDGKKQGFAQKMEGVHLMEANSEENLWILAAKEAESENQDIRWMLKGLDITFFGDNSIKYFVISNFGEIEIQSKNLKMWGEVKVTTSTGYSFDAEELLYDSETRKILSPNPVELVGPKDKKGKRLSFFGDRLEALLESNDFVLDGNVKAFKSIKNKLNLSMTSDNARFSSALNKVQEFENVNIEYGDKTIKGPKAIVYLVEDQPEIKEMVVTGGVSLKDGKNFGKSQSLLMDIKKNKLEMQGAPRFFSDNDELLGEKIIFHNGGERIEVIGAKASIQEGNGAVLDSGE